LAAGATEDENKCPSRQWERRAAESGDFNASTLDESKLQRAAVAALRCSRVMRDAT